MESYITIANRKKYVNMDDTDSEVLTLKTGVPQGSILGPLFFYYIYKWYCASQQHLWLIIYADDTTLSTTLEIVLRNAQTLDTESTLNNELANVSNCLTLNKLSLNVQKCKNI